MFYHALTSYVALGQVKQMLASFFETISTFLNDVLSAVTSFLQSQNLILIGAILCLVGILTIIGLFHFIARRPKLFIVLLIILALFVGASYLASM